jgi:hypothetical protein
MRSLATAFVLTVSLGGCKATEPPTRNPPAPRQVDSRGVPLDLRADEVMRNADGTCSFMPSIECPPPEEATCNPPAPIPVDCPGERAASASATATSKPAVIATGEPENARASIGVATMEADGTIVLQLRAEGPGGAVGEGLIRYAKDDPQYEDVLKHLGALKPGESKPVPPWPDDRSP